MSRPALDRRAPSRAGFSLALAAAAVLLCACNPTGGSSRSDLKLTAPSSGSAQSQALPPLAGEPSELIGQGPIKIALIVPLTQASGPSSVGASLRNAAQLAYLESGQSDVSIVVKDDHSSPAGAATAAQAAVNEGAELILGPVFAAGVKEAGRVAKGAGKPVIAFSTDSSAAARGVYLLSFLVEGNVERIIDFAAQRGKKSAAALVPDNEYGALALAQFQQSAANHGMRVVVIEKYKPGQPADAVKRIAAVAGQIDTLFIPDSPEAMGAVARELTAANLDSKHVQILGTSLWNDPRALKLPALQGAWFAAPENAGFNAFAGRYRAKFGSEPSRIATLTYDAVTLAIALSRQQGSQRFTDSSLTNPAGFNGADGVFRFRAEGLNDRALSVLEINDAQPRVISPAPRTLGPASSG
ncbi:penicillin-binding protein activator [Methylocystis bryophila]|uniref:Ethanolamine utilization protein EutM n=1 Tax=Methylocystis bryophila TaxID=655015 RepID=A0A1W6N0Q2_9HYPH|nr:penicillin-binding protein activator [Methylocystis bryophila]ARN83415.1 ethanolamine utilization protein EutM [Methylocystis bryophila]